MTTQDLVKGLDITGLDIVSGSEINQIVDIGRLASDKGFRILTTDTALDIPDVPNPDSVLEGVTPTWWKRYKWVRLPFNSTGIVREYNWNDQLVAPDPTYLKWRELANITALEASVAAANANSVTAVATANAASATATTAQNSANAAQATANTANTTANAARDTGTTNTGNITTLQGNVTTLQTNVTSVTNNLTLLTNKLVRVPLASFILRDSKGQGVGGGNSTGAAWQKRDLTILENNNLAGYCTLNGDSTFNLVAGVWRIIASAPAVGVGAHQIRLMNNLAGAAILGSSEISSVQVSSRSQINTCNFILSASSIFQIEHYCANAVVNGLGMPCNITAGAETYTVVELQYLGDPV